ncbi:MAG: hypothetical protein ACFFCH_04720 [Promethearchaeota archaeon]
MADEGTARTLVSIGAWLAFIFWLIGIIALAALAVLFLPFFMGDILLWLFAFGTIMIIVLVFSIFTIIFFILWFRWRHDPSAHKTGLIITGIFGLFLAYGLPGLLVLIGGAIAPSETA